jgi:hypothetical protein
MRDAVVPVEESMMRSSLIAIAALGLSCGGTEYVYRPQQPNTLSGGLPATRTEIPQERPQGSVEVLSYGVTNLRANDNRFPALHVRLIVSNNGDPTPWRLDTREQIVEIANEGRAAPIYVNGDVRTLPMVTIPQKSQRVLDLYYPLPATVEKASQLPRFELIWEVDTAARTVASRTAFDRIEPEPDYAVYPYGTAWPYWAGYGPSWWYDPFYPRAVYIHSRPIVIRDRRDRVSVGRFDGRFRPDRGAVVRRR